MTVPQRRLAGLWPWLLIAALQVVFGQTGLELAAAVETERSAPRAVIKVTLLRHEPTGKPITLEGLFVGGSAGSAEGKLMQDVLRTHTQPTLAGWLAWLGSGLYCMFGRLERSGILTPSLCLSRYNASRVAMESQPVEEKKK